MRKASLAASEATIAGVWVGGNDRMVLVSLWLFAFVVLIVMPIAAFAWVADSGLKQGWRLRVAVLVVVMLTAFAFHAWSNRSGLYYVLADADSVAADGMPKEPFFSFP